LGFCTLGPGNPSSETISGAAIATTISSAAKPPPEQLQGRHGARDECAGIGEVG
jgi:hypothetical protein